MFIFSQTIYQEGYFLRASTIGLSLSLSLETYLSGPRGRALAILVQHMYGEIADSVRSSLDPGLHSSNVYGYLSVFIQTGPSPFHTGCRDGGSIVHSRQTSHQMMYRMEG